ncbi:MAG: oligopeptide:H+ symporter [Planctomycetaceae bacterium]|jgi:dipeptide/tripeptide permease|nr:oligopeptide:H+ symporter [Planctomycetaceae bacterium]
MNNGTQSVRHPAGLWVLFTTEMWERFSFYTMRAILVLYLVDISTSEKTPGFGWSEADAYKLYGWYTGLVYIAPLLGGLVADRFLGQRVCVIIGAVLMALGEFCLAATEFVRSGNVDINLHSDLPALLTFYAGLGLMVLGNGFFKPCISVMVGQLYAPGDRRRDAGFTIFYMGINIGAFMSPLLGGTIGEIYGYQYGFIIAGLGMICGLISFTMFGQKHIKGLGKPPVKHGPHDQMTAEERETHAKEVHEQQRPLVKQDWDRIFVILVLCVSCIAFWVTFEQAGSSLNIFAKANTNREISPAVHNMVPGVLRKAFLTNEDFVAYKDKVQRVQKLTEKLEHHAGETKPATFADRLERFNFYGKFNAEEKEEDKPIEVQITELKQFAAGLKQKLRTSKYEDVQKAITTLEEAVKADDKAVAGILTTELTELETILNADGNNPEAVEMVNAVKKDIAGMTDSNLIAEAIREAKKNPVLVKVMAGKAYTAAGGKSKEEIASHEQRRDNIRHAITALLASEQGADGVSIQDGLVAMEQAERIFDVRYVPGTNPQTFPATWYQSVNACGIVIFAPMFAFLWGFLAHRGIEPSTPTKFALGLILVSVSFIVMIPGAIEAKMTGGKAAAYWLLLCYLFATWGELCVSPVGLSMITKLAPARYCSIFMGIWFLSSSVAYILAGYAASYFGTGEGVNLFFGKDGGLADFFLLMALFPMLIGLIALSLAPTLKKMMHGVH